jgi:hypothetical protein
MKYVRLNINGTYYNSSYIVSMQTHRSLFDSEPSVGNCICGELEATLLIPNGSIPRNAKVVPYVKEDNGAWQKKSEFFIYSRSTDYVSGALTITAYDAIFKAEAPFVLPGNVGQWPRTDKTVMQEIASRTGTTISSESLSYMDKSYQIQFPGITVEGESGTEYEVDGTTMREVAGYIASMYAGNWIIDNAGQWRLIRLGDVPPITNYLIEEHGDVILIGGVRILV